MPGVPLSFPSCHKAPLGLVCRLALLAALVPSAAWSRPQTAPAAPSPTQPPSRGDYVFGAPTGMLVFHVRPESRADFEAVMARVVQGLDATTDPVRRSQRANWRLFRAAEGASAALYVLWVDPVVGGADYDPIRLITELLPAESQDLYERLKQAVVKVERLSLAPVR